MTIQEVALAQPVADHTRVAAPQRTSTAVSHGSAIAVAAVIGISAAACVFRLGSASLWLDEAWSAMLTRASFGEFFDQVQGEGGSQVLHYLLLRGWSTFGHSEAWLRLPSVLFAVATLVVLHRLTVRLFDRRVALIAIALLGINPFFVRYAQEARGYTLAMLLVTSATYAFVSGVETGARRSWFLYGMLGALSVYAHMFTLFVLAAHGLSLLALPRRRFPLRGLCLGAATAAVLLVPLALLLWTANGQIDDVGGRSLEALKVVVASLAGARGWPANIVIGAAWIAAGLLAVGVARTRGRDLETWRLGLVVSWAAAPLAMAMVLSIASPILLDRYLISTIPALALLAAIGLNRLDSRLLVAAMAFVLVLSAVRIRDQAGELRHEEDWRLVASSVFAETESGDTADRLIFQLPWMSVPFQHYALVHDGDVAGVSFHVPGEGYLPIHQIPEGDDVTVAASRSRLFAEPVARSHFGWIRAYRPHELAHLAAADGATVWLIARGEHPDVSVQQIASAIDDSHELVEEQAFGVIRVFRYEPVSQ